MAAVRAHVGILPERVAPETTYTFTVRVPNERNVPTVKVRLDFPPGLLVSRFQPKPGWQREIIRDVQQRPIGVVWSGGSIAPDEYDDFAFIARTPRQPGKLVFKAYQTYQDGETVEWVNDAEPRPAPVVEVAAEVAGAEAPPAPRIETAPHTTVPPAPPVQPTPAAPSATAAPATGAPPSAFTTAPQPTVAVTVAPISPTATVAPTTANTSTPAPPAASGSDLSLFVALAAAVLALIAVILSTVALLRRAPGA